jgi:hypothetical protein
MGRGIVPSRRLRGQNDAAAHPRTVPAIEILPRGPFSLAAAQDVAGGFPAGIRGGGVGEGDVSCRTPRER